MSKYNEPWKVLESSSETTLILGHSGDLVGEVNLYDDTVDSDANAVRIVACVNACAGMEDPVAEIARLREYEWMYKQLAK